MIIPGAERDLISGADSVNDAPSAVLSPAPRSRRSLVGLGLATAAVAAVDLRQPARAAAAEDDQTLHLLKRATFGVTPELLAAVKKQGASAWLASQLDPASILDAEMDAMLARWKLLGLRTWEVRERLSYASWDVMNQMIECHVARAIWSKRQLLEVVVGFWTNHLVVPAPVTEVWDCAHLFHRDVIRTHALGKYADMLVAAARHPAMLNILDNATSSKKAPNENYGRELLELHTVGVGNYTEADVRNSALALTGLSVDSENGLYEYKPQRRYLGTVKVLGWSHSNTSPEAGERVALLYLNYLARHPKTAARIARKLAVRFVSDNPPESLVSKLATVYLQNDTAIVPVLKTLFASTEFAAAAGAKLKTPYEDAVSTLRILKVSPEPSGTAEMRSLLFTLAEMGQVPMGWPAPNGFPDVAAAWCGASGTLGRWNCHVRVAGGWGVAGMPRPSLNELLPDPVPKTFGAYVDALATSLLVGPVTTKQKAAICTFLGKAPGDVLQSTHSALSWQLKYVVALLLNSTNFITR